MMYKIILIILAVIIGWAYLYSLLGANGKDEHCENAEHCVYCGEIIPESYQVCPNCEKEKPKEFKC